MVLYRSDNQLLINV